MSEPDDLMLTETPPDEKAIVVEERPEGDPFQAAARLREAIAERNALDVALSSVGLGPAPGMVEVAVADLQLVLDVPLAHALTDEAVRRAIEAARRSNGRYDLYLGLTKHSVAAMRAAIVAALGVPEAGR